MHANFICFINSFKDLNHLLLKVSAFKSQVPFMQSGKGLGFGVRHVEADVLTHIK